MPIFTSIMNALKKAKRVFFFSYQTKSKQNYHQFLKQLLIEERKIHFLFAIFFIWYMQRERRSAYLFCSFATVDHRWIEVPISLILKLLQLIFKQIWTKLKQKSINYREPPIHQKLTVIHINNNLIFKK